MCAMCVLYLWDIHIYVSQIQVISVYTFSIRVCLFRILNAVNCWKYSDIKLSSLWNLGVGDEIIHQYNIRLSFNSQVAWYKLCGLSILIRLYFFFFADCRQSSELLSKWFRTSSTFIFQLMHKYSLILILFWSYPLII